MNKNDFEVWIFHYLIENDLKDMSNYEVSIRLKIPESKVKRLRYEADLRYEHHEDSDLFLKLNKKLENVQPKKNGTCVQFAIEDVTLRKFIDSKLKEKGRFSDSSFNSEIVTLDVDDLDYLYKENQSKELRNLLEETKRLTGKDDITFPKICRGIMEMFKEEGGKKVVDLTIDGVFNLLKNTPKIIPVLAALL